MKLSFLFFLKQILKTVHLANPTQTITRQCMEDNLILGLLLSKLLTHTELPKWKILSPLTLQPQKRR